jgi:ABC-type lipoprotein export system ATPase subunit
VIGLIKNAAREANATLLISTHDSRVRAHFERIIPVGGRA